MIHDHHDHDSITTTTTGRTVIIDSRNGGAKGGNGTNGDDIFYATTDGRTANQIHLYANDGNDTIHLNLSVLGLSTIQHGHHVFAGGGADKIVFDNLDKLRGTIVGRLDDINHSEDQIWIGGQQLDLRNPQQIQGYSVSVVSYQGQQWLQMVNAHGGRALYALESARKVPVGDGTFTDEAHFLAWNHQLPDKLPVVAFEDPVNWLPAKWTNAHVAEREIIPKLDTWEATTLSGSWQDDFILTRRGDDVISGGPGNDYIFSHMGNDRIYGGAGNDLIEASNGFDLVYAGAGNDSISGGTDADTLHGGDGNDVIYGGSENDALSGGAGQDYLHGGTGNDRLNGGTGQDTMMGGSGNDTYWVDVVGDRIIEHANAGIDTVLSSIPHRLSANLENLTLLGTGNINGTGNNLANRMLGNSGNNTLLGGFGSDTLKGGAGRDVLDGGAGKDFLFGGAGSDRFVFRNIAETGVGTTRDVIKDYSSAEGDRIDLRHIDANHLQTNDQAFHFVGINNFTGMAGQLRYERAGSGVIVSGDVNGDGRADFSIQIDGIQSLAANDFLL